MELTDILKFLAGLLTGSLLTITVNHVRKTITTNGSGKVDNSSTKSDQRGSHVNGSQSGRDTKN